MRAVLVGDAVVGNPTFGVGLRNAPANTNAVALASNIGACTSPGLNLSFCQPVRVPLGPIPPLVLIFGVPGSAGTCNFDFTIPAPLPLATSACGFTYSFQWVVGCKGSPANYGITNCVSFAASGS